MRIYVSDKDRRRAAIVGGVIGAAVGALNPSEGALTSGVIGGLTGLITNEAGQMLTAENKPGGFLENFNNFNWSSYAFSGADGFLAAYGSDGLQDLMTDEDGLGLNSTRQP